MEDAPNQGKIPTGNEPDVHGEAVKKDLKGLLASGKKFVFELLDISGETDQESTIASIANDVQFKGHTTWILICSIFIASVGLNANSTAVVIGAMLISPLMGPILGIGLSLAINDIDTLRRSLKNFGVMVTISVITAFLFFAFFPLREESTELLARTKPDIRDVLIAFFGGLALIIARTKKGTIASVIFGVAIATALMPPLCTVGFGLANGNYQGALGALYLFLINTIFIALATFLVIKLLGFPMVRYANSQRRRTIARFASIVALLVMVPATFTFYNVLQESLFKKQAVKFITEEIASYEFNGGGRFLDDFSDVEYNNGNSPFIELVFIGNETIPQNVIANWNARMAKYSRLQNCDLHIIQGAKNETADQYKYIDELYQVQKSELGDKAQRIEALEHEVLRLNKVASKQIPFQDISAEAKVNHENLANLGFAYAIKTDFNKFDTLPVFEVTWKKGLNKSNLANENDKLLKWLKIRLKDSLVQLREIE